jgi:hypothetical protein
MGAKRTSATVFPIRDIPLDFPAPASIGVSDRRPTMAAWQNARRSPGSGWWERRNQAALMETTPMSKPTKDLSVPQLLILTTAASRPDRMVMPLPSTLRARGASQQRLLTSVLKLALVEEVPTDTLILSWRHDEQGQHYALQLTTVGLAAVTDTSAPASVEPSPSPAEEAAVAEEETDTAPVAEDVGVCSDPSTTTPGGKLGKLLAAIGAENGATVEDLMTLTGWQKHTTRAAITRLRQRGYPLQLIKRADRKAYCLIFISSVA